MPAGRQRRRIAGLAHRLLVLPEAQPGLDRAGGTTRRDDEALAVLGEDLLVHAGLVEVALEVGPARQLERACPRLAQNSGGILK